MATPPVLFLLGAGSNIGAAIAKTFASSGYKVALAARSLRSEISPEGYFHVPLDLSDPDSVPAAFEQVTQKFGTPSVVVYNAAKFTGVPADDPLRLAVSDLSKDLSISMMSPLVAAHQAVLGFAQLPQDASRTFIFTGNGLNTQTIPALISLGIGKSAMAHVIMTASVAYKQKGYRFYYADERKPDGAVAGTAISGPAHADFYLQLAKGNTEVPWWATFVKDQGYMKFDR